MSLRIPLTPDQTLQVEFHEIERRLRKLERATGVLLPANVNVTNVSSGVSNVNLQPIYDRLEALELGVGDPVAVPELVGVGAGAQRGSAPSPGTGSPPTGIGEHVLKEDATWGFPLRGLVRVATSGEDTDLAWDIVDVNAALHAQAISVADVECHSLRTHGEVEYEDTFYDDLRVEPVARTTGANSPAFEKYFDDSGGTSRGVYLYSLDDAAGGSEKELFFTMQMPHNWKEGTPVDVHVHWVGSAADTTADPRFGLEYCMMDVGQTFVDTTIVYSAGAHYPGDPGGASDPDVTVGKHYVTPLVTITPAATGNNVSAVLIGRLFRDSADAGDTYDVATNKVGVLYIDAHYQIDTPGSRAQWTK